MKSKIVLIAALSAATLALVGCGNSASTEQKAEDVKADGVYTAQMDDASAEAAYGWRDQLEVEYKDGKIVSAVFESYDADGNKKSEISPDVYPMVFNFYFNSISFDFFTFIRETSYNTYNISSDCIKIF